MQASLGLVYMAELFIYKSISILNGGYMDSPKGLVGLAGKMNCKRLGAKLDCTVN